MPPLTAAKEASLITRLPAGRRTEAAVGSIPPDDAVAEAFRRRRRGERPNRVCCKKIS